MTARGLTALVGHSWWGRGGAEIAAVWTIQALQQAGFKVSVVTRGGFDGDSLNTIAGAKMAVDDIELVVVSGIPMPFMGHLAHARYLRKIRAIAGQFDLCVSASGVLDWGREAIHFVSSVTWNDHLGSQFESRIEKPDLLRRIMYLFSKFLVGRSGYQQKKDLFVANSHWTAQVSRPEIAGSLEVLAPPVVVGKASSLGERSNDFVYLGRMAPEKEIWRCIRIVRRLRDMGHDVRLHLIGELNADSCGQSLQAHCDNEPDLLVAHGACYGDEKWELLSRFQFGINACPIEAFGMATAEMIAAGLIVFAPKSGAQKELLKHDDLLWIDEDDAVRKINRAINDTQKYSLMISPLARSVQAYSPVYYMTKVAQLATTFSRGGLPTDECFLRDQIP